MSLLRNKSFFILFSGQVVSTFGTNLFLLALPWYVYLLTGSKADLAIVGFVQSLPGVIGMFAGVYVDRWNKCKTMIVSDLLRCLLSIALGIIAYFGLPFPLIVMVVLLLQLVGTVFGPAESALIPMVVSEEQVPAAMGMNQSGNATAQLAGQIGGGALMTVLGAPFLFIANGLSFLVSVISLFFIHAPEPARKRTSTSFFTEWKEGLAIVRRSKLVILILISAIITNFGLAAFDIAITAWVRGPLQGSAFELGVIGAAFFLGIILGGGLLGLVTKKVPLRWTLMLGLLITGTTIGGVGAFSNAYWTMFLLGLCGISVGILNGSVGALAIQVVPAAMRGRVFGLLTAFCTLASPLGIAVFGWLMIHISLQVLFSVMGSLSILGGLAFLIPIKEDITAMDVTVHQA